MSKLRLPASYSTRHRWTAAIAQPVLAALDSSGLSVAAFAAREGLDAQRLYSWRRRLSAEAPSPPRFIEVLGQAAARERVEIVLRSGHVVRVADSIDVGVLRRLVDALEQDLAC